MKSIFENLFSRFGSAIVKSWEIKPNGSYKLELAKQIKIWVPADKTDPTVGGSVLIFGHSDKKPYVTGTIDKKNKILHFSDGFVVNCVHHIVGKVAPNVYSMAYKNENEVAFTAGMFIKKDTKSKTVQEFCTAWGKTSDILSANTNNYEYIAKKG